MTKQEYKVYRRFNRMKGFQKMLTFVQFLILTTMASGGLTEQIKNDKIENKEKRIVEVWLNYTDMIYKFWDVNSQRIY